MKKDKRTPKQKMASVIAVAVAIIMALGMLIPIIAMAIAR